MKSAGNGSGRKRMKPDMEEKDGDELVELEIVEKEESETIVTGSEEMELNISQILEKIETFTQMVSELLDAVKTTLKELSNEFEERIIMIHKEQIEKWQEEIKELRTFDASNEEANALLHNARYVLQHTRIG
ncbi:hypothetical protein L6164_010384 [Bauhinia variegata]|uniref:Uncharacterized protein n=1 Tax=Bauhinia variegata TaxID=167791 RepID=A0ACB9PTB1_BAUVA|nr:hypothetical protein L6164_010384 [Bauhinia variegata]